MAFWATLLSSYRRYFFKLTGASGISGNSKRMTPQKSRTQPVNTPDQPAAGKGMPVQDPQAQKPMVDRQPDFNDGSVEQTLELPRDRDEAKDMTSSQPDPMIEQAAKDLKDGLKDTSKAAEMDKTYEKFRP